MKRKKISRKKILLLGGIIVFVLLLLAVSFFVRNYTSIPELFFEEESFSVNPFLIKLVISPGEEVSSVLRIKNNEDFGQNFKISLDGVENLVSLNTYEFELGSKQIMEILLRVEDKEMKHEIYIGNLIVEGDTLQKKVPITINVEPEIKKFTITHSDIPQYRDPFPGGKVGVDIKIFNLLNKELESIEMNYRVMDFDGTVLVSDAEVLSLVDSVSTSKIFELPPSTPLGNYILVTSLEFNGYKSFATYFFEVKEKEEKIVFGKFEYGMLLVFLFALIVSFIFASVFNKKDRYLRKLNCIQKEELEKNLAIIREYRRELHGVKNLAQRKEKLKQLGKEKENALKEIKEKQKKQLQEFKKLKKEKNENKMKKKLSEWMNEGYHFNELKKSVKSVPKKAVKDQLEELKKQGYRTDFLGKK